MESFSSYLLESRNKQIKLEEYLLGSNIFEKDLGFRTDCKLNMNEQYNTASKAKLMQFQYFFFLYYQKSIGNLGCV